MKTTPGGGGWMSVAVEKVDRGELAGEREGRGGRKRSLLSRLGRESCRLCAKGPRVLGIQGTYVRGPDRLMAVVTRVILTRARMRMTIYAGNFKDEISFAREYVPTSTNDWLFRGVAGGWRWMAKGVGGERLGLSFLHVTLGITGPRIIQRFAFVTRQHGVAGETWRGSRQREAKSNSGSRVDDAVAGSLQFESVVEPV